MKPGRLSPYERSLDACIGDDTERRVCQWVAEKIVKTRARFSQQELKSRSSKSLEIFPALIFREIGGSDDSYYGKIINALHKMSMRSIGMLEMRYEWHEDGGDMLALGVPIEGREVADALRAGKMYSPISGELIVNFFSHVHVVYIARTDKDPFQIAEELAWI